MALMAGLPRDGRPYRVVALGAQADDVEIGAGATIMQLLTAHPDAAVHWMVFASDGERGPQTEDSARELLGACLGSLHLHEVRAGFLPREWSGVKEVLLQIGRRVRPDVVFAPTPAQARGDHRVLGELAWQVFREALVLGYELPAGPGERLAPSLYVPVPADTVGAKLDHLKRHSRGWGEVDGFDEIVRASMRLRGVECGTRYAEAFDARSLTLTF
ncbi:putative LmbE-like protein [Frankia sp. QA3]|nr:putative LmbE-like protein [Frankia sp. QA3]